MPFYSLISFNDTSDGIYVLVRWIGLSHVEDTFVPIGNVLEDAPQILLCHLYRKSIPTDPVGNTRQ